MVGFRWPYPHRQNADQDVQVEYDNRSMRGLTMAFPIAQLFVAKLIVDDVLRVVQTVHTVAQRLNSPHAKSALAWLAFECLLLVMQDAAARFGLVLESSLSEKWSTRMGSDLLSHASNIELELIEDPDVQAQLERARRQMASRANLVQQTLGLVQIAIGGVTVSAGLFAYSAWTVPILLFSLLPSLKCQHIFASLRYEESGRQAALRRELDYLRLVGSGNHVAKEVRSFALRDFLVERFTDKSVALNDEGRHLLLREAKATSLTSLLATLGYCAVLGWAIFDAVTGKLGIGDLTFVAASVRRVRTLLESGVTAYSNWAGLALYLEDLYAFLRLPVKKPALPGGVPFPQPIKKGFSFVGVGFKYPGSNQWVVRDLNFELRIGETTALVGVNGSGKTTIVKLLCGLYEPTEGSILLDDLPLPAFDPCALRENISVMYQDFARYQFSISENIAAGSTGRTQGGSIVRASKKANLSEVIETFPNGYDQLLGRLFKEGIELSGGQWQKVALARAHFRDAPILIMDEPMAAMDARSEAMAIRELLQVGPSTLSLLISHRISNARLAHCIIVLEGGHIRECGTHAELVAAKDRYAELFELQANGYR
jgi:ATP-binding cassette subfamily B protein